MTAQPEAQPSAATEALVSWLLSCRTRNTEDWMAGLCLRLNSYAHATGDQRRVIFRDDRLILYEAGQHTNHLCGDGDLICKPEIKDRPCQRNLTSQH